MYIYIYISQQYVCVIYTATCFDTFMSSSDSLQPISCKVTHLLQIASVENRIYKIKLYHINLLAPEFHI